MGYAQDAQCLEVLGEGFESSYLVVEEPDMIASGIFYFEESVSARTLVVHNFGDRPFFKVPDVRYVVELMSWEPSIVIRDVWSKEMGVESWV